MKHTLSITPLAEMFYRILYKAVEILIFQQSLILTYTNNFPFHTIDDHVIHCDRQIDRYG